MESDNLLKASELQLRQNEHDNAREERQHNQEYDAFNAKLDAASAAGLHAKSTGAKSSIFDSS